MSDQFRFCIYCGVDIYTALPMHREDCPELTGVFPVLKQDVGPDGLQCFDCHAELLEGDSYMERKFGKDEQDLTELQRGASFEGLVGVVLVCTGCGVLAHD